MKIKAETTIIIILVIIGVIILLFAFIFIKSKRWGQSSLDYKKDIPPELKEKATEFINLYQQKKSLGFNTKEIESVITKIKNAMSKKDYNKISNLLSEGIILLKNMEVFCGDKLCSFGEDCNNCQTDCGNCDIYYCGDNTCNNDETCITCETDCEECNILFFSDGFETGKMSTGWNGFLLNIEKGKPMELPDLPIDELGTYILENTDAMEIVTDPVRNGNYAIKMTVEQGDGHNYADLIIKKDRSELSRLGFGDEATPGAEHWYAISILIPEDDSYVHEGGDNFNIVTQWLHSSITEEEKSVGMGSPSILLEYRQNSNGTAGMILKYGVGKAGKESFPTQIQKGVWIDWVFHIKWSLEDDGFVEAWKDGEPVTPWNGENYKVYKANMLNEEPYFYKIGIYRGHNIQTTNSVYYDEVKISSEPLI